MAIPVTVNVAISLALSAACIVNTPDGFALNPINDANHASILTLSALTSCINTSVMSLNATPPVQSNSISPDEGPVPTPA